MLKFVSRKNNSENTKPNAECGSSLLHLIGPKFSDEQRHPHPIANCAQLYFFNKRISETSRKYLDNQVHRELARIPNKDYTQKSSCL